MPNVGPLELAIILIIALIVFGPKKLPELGRSMGRGIREFRHSVSGKGEGEREPAAEEQGELRGGESDDSEPLEAEVVADNRP